MIKSAHRNTNMKFFTLLIAVLFCFHLDYVLLDYVEFPKFHTPTTTSATTSSKTDWLDNIPVEDILSSGTGINANEKIQQKIINTVTQYASDYNVNRKILVNLSTEGYEIPRWTMINVNLGSYNAVLNHIRIFESSYTKKNSYSTLIECQSTKTTKIEVKLRKDIEISAHLKVAKITNSSDFRTMDVSHEGSISLILKPSISKQFPSQRNDENSTTWKIFYSKTGVYLDIAAEFQIPIYHELQTILNEIEPPLKQFLIEKFDVEFNKSGISMADVCSKFINNNENSKTLDLPYFNNNPHNLYLIQNWGIVSWMGYFETRGPFLVYDLSSFNSTQLIVSEYEPPNDDLKINAITVKIKTNDLKAKVDYWYNSELVSITYTIEFIEFEVRKRNILQYESKSRSNISDCDIQVSVNLGKIEGNVSDVRVIKEPSYKNPFWVVHTGQLDYYVSVKLKKSLEEKFQKESLFGNCR